MNAVNVNSGILNLTGSIASTLTTVNSGGELMGTGTVGTTTIASGGTFAPGSGTPGTSMAVSGNLAFTSGALYLVQLNPTTASFASVTGTATLNGATVNATYANGSYISKKYTILTATSGVSGTFGPLVNTNLPANFSTSLSYDAHDVFLNLTLGFVPPPNGGLNQNQQNVANAIVNFFNSTGSIPLVFGALTPAGLTQLSGESATGSQQTTFDAMNLFMSLLTDPFITGRGNPSAPAAARRPMPTRLLNYAAKRSSDAYAMYTKAPPVHAIRATLERVGGWLRRVADGPTATPHSAPTTPAATSTAPLSAPTIASRRTRSQVLRSPAAAPISASTISATADPTCSRPAASFARISARPTSPAHSPMAGRTSPPTAS